jgi:hypothetical protein
METSFCEVERAATWTQLQPLLLGSRQRYAFWESEKPTNVHGVALGSTLCEHM